MSMKLTPGGGNWQLIYPDNNQSMTNLLHEKLTILTHFMTLCFYLALLATSKNLDSWTQ
jgi:hypothetical protein